MMHCFNCSTDVIKKIKAGTKRNALKDYFLPLEGKRVGIVNSETGRIALVIKVGKILDLTILSQEDKEVIKEEEGIPEELRPYFSPNFMYTIESFETIQ